MTGFESKRNMAQDKLDDEADTLTIVYQQGFADGKRSAERKSFAEKYPLNPDAKCKCEHWQACIDCHPTYIESVLKGDA